MSVLFITHDLGVVAQVADDVIVMNQGRILETGTVRQVLKTPLHPYTQGLLQAVPHKASAKNRKARLQTVAETTAGTAQMQHPLVSTKDGRRVALPIEEIPAEIRP